MILRKWKCVITVPLFTVTILLSVPALSQSKTQPVLVLNTSTQPVPTAPQGTTNVAGTVNVGNTPSVSIANTPAVSLVSGSNVNVSNPLNAQNNPTPLAVLEAIQPYELECSFQFAGTETGQCSFGTVPAGKRLVIQEFDAYGFMETSLKPLVITGNFHYFAATPMGTGGSFDYFATHQLTRLYAGPNAAPSCSVSISAVSNQGQYTCQLSGFLVDVP